MKFQKIFAIPLAVLVLLVTGCATSSHIESTVLPYKDINPLMQVASIQTPSGNITPHEAYVIGIQRSLNTAAEAAMLGDVPASERQVATAVNLQRQLTTLAGPIMLVDVGGIGRARGGSILSCLVAIDTTTWRPLYEPPCAGDIATWDHILRNISPVAVAGGFQVWAASVAADGVRDAADTHAKGTIRATEIQAQAQAAIAANQNAVTQEGFNIQQEIAGAQIASNEKVSADGNQTLVTINERNAQAAVDVAKNTGPAIINVLEQSQGQHAAGGSGGVAIAEGGHSNASAVSVSDNTNIIGVGVNNQIGNLPYHHNQR